MAMAEEPGESETGQGDFEVALACFAVRVFDGPCRIRTYNQRIMLTTTAFAALRSVEPEFVVWTIPSLYVSAV